MNDETKAPLPDWEKKRRKSLIESWAERRKGAAPISEEFRRNRRAINARYYASHKKKKKAAERPAARAGSPIATKEKTC